VVTGRHVPPQHSLPPTHAGLAPHWQFRPEQLSAVRLEQVLPVQVPPPASA
jgi:hypothetical protein